MRHGRAQRLDQFRRVVKNRSVATQPGCVPIPTFTDCNNAARATPRDIRAHLPHCVRAVARAGCAQASPPRPTMQHTYPHTTTTFARLITMPCTPHTLPHTTAHFTDRSVRAWKAPRHCGAYRGVLLPCNAARAGGMCMVWRAYCSGIVVGVGSLRSDHVDNFFTRTLHSGKKNNDDAAQPAWH